jgi:hypothetical protein
VTTSCIKNVFCLCKIAYLRSVRKKHPFPGPSKCLIGQILWGKMWVENSWWMQLQNSFKYHFNDLKQNNYIYLKLHTTLVCFLKYQFVLVNSINDIISTFISIKLNHGRWVFSSKWFIASLKILANKVDATNTIRDMFSKHKIIYFVWSIQLWFWVFPYCSLQSTPKPICLDFSRKMKNKNAMFLSLFTLWAHSNSICRVFVG